MVQPPFVNAVAGLLTQLDARRTAGRAARDSSASSAASRRASAGVRASSTSTCWWSGAKTRATETLTLPHPGIAERDFVLYPLADIAPDLDVPGLGRVAQLRERVANRGIERL